MTSRNVAPPTAKRVYNPHKAALPDAYCESQTGHYWVQDTRTRWMPVNETSLKRLYKGAGFTTGVPEGRRLSTLDDAILMTQQERNVEFAGGLAGYKSGAYEMLGNRILVTNSPCLIEPHPGSWDTLQAFLHGLLDDEEFDQASFVLGWLKTAVENLRSGRRRPGQALALAGPPECGKSLLQSFITEILGGRVASPYQYMVKQTVFNGEMFGAEHLMVEDSAASYDIRTRREFGAALKEITVNEVRSCHAKNRQALSLKPFWRLTISVNDEPENLMLLPPFEDGVHDKIILLRAYKRPFPMPNRTDDEKAAFTAQIKSELPAFIDFLLHWEIPVPLRNDRCGVRAWQHPALLQTLEDLAPEIRLLSLIDAEIFSGNLPEAWEGTTGEMVRRLTGSESKSAYEARQIFTFGTACGVYLARLASKRTERITKRTLHGTTIWTISPPKGEGVEGIL